MIALRWSPREVPLGVEGVVGFGDVGRQLALRVADREGDRGLVAGEHLVVFGTDLPWLDGVRYIGRDPAAPGVYFDTRLVPEVPVDLLAAACRDRYGEQVVLLPDVALGLSGLGALAPDALLRWANR